MPFGSFCKFLAIDGNRSQAYRAEVSDQAVLRDLLA